MAARRSRRSRPEPESTPDPTADDEIGIFWVEDEVDPAELQEVLEDMVDKNFRIWKILPVGDDDCTLCVVAVRRDAKNVLVEE
jgi:hypothetical protein